MATSDPAPAVPAAAAATEPDAAKQEAAVASPPTTTTSTTTGAQPSSAPAPASTEAAATPAQPAPPATASEPPATTSTEPPPAATTAAAAPLEDAPPAQPPVKVDESRPEDFEGEVTTNDDLPAPETLKKVEDYIVLDRHGKTLAFKNIYTGKNVARRVLIIFVRHFFCGNCQEFLRSLSESITPEALLRLPVSTFIAVIGCGDPGLIDMYVQETGCPFPVYTDPTRQLFATLGMTRTLAMGEKPAYMKQSLLRGAMSSIVQGLKQVRSGLVLRAGDQRQVGGEFMFEPLSLAQSPVSTPQGAIEKAIGVASPGTEGDEDTTEEKRITWCHRMRTTRDHAEIPELMEVLGLDGHGQPIDDKKRWSKALETRKGTGLSMASQMSQLEQQGGGTA